MAYYEEYAGTVKQAAQTYGVDESLIWAVIEQESGGDPAASSDAGAVGLMQLMPATAKQYGVTDRTDPEQNIMGGTALLSDLLDRYGGDKKSALAAYVAGPGNVSRFGKEKYSWYYTDVLDKMTADMLTLDPPKGGFLDHGTGDIVTETGVFTDSGLDAFGNFLLLFLIVGCLILGIIFIYLCFNNDGMYNVKSLMKGTLI